MPFLLLLLLTSWGSSVCALRDPELFCFGSCQQSLAYVQFNATNPETGSPWGACRNELEISTLFLCIKVYCTADERAAAFASHNRTCQARWNATLPPYSIIEHYSDDDILKLHHLEPEEATGATDSVVNEVMIPSERLYQLAYDTLVRYSRISHDGLWLTDIF